jgi:hypothetical protein
MKLSSANADKPIMSNNCGTYMVYKNGPRRIDPWIKPDSRSQTWKTFH